MAVSPSMKAYQAKLEEYLRKNKREQGYLVENRAQSIRMALFKEYKAIAPSKERIEQEARGSLAAGKGLKRGTSKKGKLLSVEAEIRRRKSSRMFLASSFIAKGWRTNRKAGSGQFGVFQAKTRKGRTTGLFKVRTAAGMTNPAVTLSSLLEGAGTMNDRRQLVDKAIGAEIADMEAYLVKKKKQEFVRSLRRALIYV